MPTRQAIIPDLVGRDLAPGAISLTAAGAQVAAPVSIFVSGIFVDTFGFGETYAISCLGHAAAVIALLLMRYRPTIARALPGARYGVRETYRDVRAGLAYTRSQSTLLWVIVLLTTIMVMGFPAVANLGPTWVTTVVGVSFRNFGFVAIFWGGSAFLTSLLLTRFSYFTRKGAILALAALLFATGFCIFSTGTLAGAIAGNAALGCGMAAAQITAASLVQHIAPNEVRGRVMSILWLNMGLAQLVTFPIAAIAQVSSLRVLFPVMATALTIVVILIVLTRPQVRRARVELAPARPLESPV
jgi:MFS family permease